jgi:hypothetical protein
MLANKHHRLAEVIKDRMSDHVGKLHDKKKKKKKKDWELN